MKFIGLNLVTLLVVVFAVFTAEALTTRLQGEDLVTGKPAEIHLDKNHKALVVTFLSAKCPCSDSHVVALKQLREKFPQMQFVAVHANADEPRELSRAYFSKVDLGAGFAVVQDEGLKLADQFGAYKTPHSFVVSPEGRLLYQGGMTDSSMFPRAKVHYLAEALADIQSGQSVRTTEGRTLGCVITRGDEKAPWSN